MRTRRTLLLALIISLALIPMALAPVVALAAQKALEDAGGVVLAQELDPDEGEPGDPVEDTDADQAGETGGEDGEGQKDPDTQSGADEEEQTEAAVEEGPIWTYQMARLGIALLVLLLLAIGFTYWKLVAQRQRSGV